MEVLILADRLGKSLLPLTEDTPVALLPLAGKPVIEHTLDALADCGLKSASIAVSVHADRMRALLGEGRRWGLSLEFLPTRGEENPAVLLERLPAGDARRCLLIRGDILRSGNLAAFMAQAAAVPGGELHGVIHGRPAGIALVSRGAAKIPSVRWPLSEMEGLPAECLLELGAGSVYPLDTLSDYHRANLDAAAGEIAGLRLPGRETALGLVQGRATRVSPRSLRLGKAFIGSGSRIDATAQLYGTVAISDEVIVDRMARLTNTVVLPHTYVGELVDLREAIVSGNHLIRVDNGAQVQIADAFLLADLRQNTLGTSLLTPLQRVVAALLLLLSLPLWPIAALAAYLEHPEAPLRRRRLRGNRVEPGEFGQPQRSEFTLYEWATRIPLLRALPRLLAVVTADLRLVGVEPVTAEQAEFRLAEWERLADSAPAGLIGPTQLRLDRGAPEEERLMSDAFYAAHRGHGTDLRLLLEALLSVFSRRAWREAK